MFYILLADGFEEVEAIATIDMLKRGGVEITMAGLEKLTVTGSHGIGVLCDCLVGDISFDSVEGVILPGGLPGTTNLDNSPAVHKLLSYAFDNDKYICAICAAPSVLGQMGILKGKKAVCYPGYENELTGAILSDESVVRDGKVITAKGAGVTIDFGLEIVAALKGTDAAEKIRKGIQCRG